MMWTTKQERRLALLINDGLSNSQIAEQMGRKLRSITAKINELGLGRRKNKTWTTVQLKQVYEMYNSGHRLHEIATAVNSSGANIRNILYNARKRGDIGYRNNVRSISRFSKED